MDIPAFFEGLPELDLAAFVEGLPDPVVQGAIAVVVFIVLICVVSEANQ
jgi:hypothetical protein